VFARLEIGKKRKLPRGYRLRQFWNINTDFQRKPTCFKKKSMKMALHNDLVVKMLLSRRSWHYKGDITEYALIEKVFASLFY
jgi:hypothetical protein